MGPTRYNYYIYSGNLLWEETFVNNIIICSQEIFAFFNISIAEMFATVLYTHTHTHTYSRRENTRQQIHELNVTSIDCSIGVFNYPSVHSVSYHEDHAVNLWLYTFSTNCDQWKLRHCLTFSIAVINQRWYRHITLQKSIIFTYMWYCSVGVYKSNLKYMCTSACVYWHTYVWNNNYYKHICFIFDL